MSYSPYFPKWHYPVSVTQFAEDPSHISWDAAGDFVYIKSKNLSKTKTIKPLVHIPVNQGLTIRNKTYFLDCKFDMTREIGQITGLQIEIQMDRGSRIIDDTIQLIKDNQVIGENIASSDSNERKIYGPGWGLDWSLDPYSIALGDFGVRLRFQSNYKTPHSTVPAIDFIRARFVINNETINKQELRPNIGWTCHLTSDKFWALAAEDLLPGSGKLGRPGFLGSINNGNNNFIGSNPFMGSYGSSGSGGGFIGSFGPVNLNFPLGYTSSNFSIVLATSSPIPVIPNITFLPPAGAFQYQAFYIANVNAIVYWDNVWLVGAS